MPETLKPTGYSDWMQKRVNFQKQETARQNAINDSKREQEANELFSCSLTATDDKSIKQYTSASRMKDLADGMRKWREEKFGKRISEGVNDNDIICTYINGFPESKNSIMNYLDGKDDIIGISKKLGFVAPENNSNEYPETFGQSLKNIGGGIVDALITEPMKAGAKATAWVMDKFGAENVDEREKAALERIDNLIDFGQDREDSVAYDISNMGTDLAQILIPGLGEKAAANILGKLATKYPKIAGLIEKSPKLTKFVKGGIEGATDASIYEGLNAETPIGEETLYGAGLGAVAPTAIDVGKGVYNVGKKVITDPKGAAIEGINKTIDAAMNVGNKIDNSLEPITDAVADKLTNTATSQDKLYKALEPRMNTIGKSKDLNNLRANADRANELIVENGFMPTDTKSRVEAYKGTMSNLWKQVEEALGAEGGTTVDQTPLLQTLDEFIKKQESLGTSVNKNGINLLKKEREAIEESIAKGETDILKLEDRKQLYNATIDNWGDQKVDDTFSNGLRLLTKKIGEIEDEAVNSLPEGLSKLKKDFGSLKATYEDALKTHIKNERKKGQGMYETIGRISGLGDIASSAINIATGKGAKGVSDLGKGVAKVVLGKSFQKAKDVDFLIEQGYKQLAEEMSKLAGK